MGSGTSKETGNTRPGGARPVTVANVNNNTSKEDGTVDSKSVNRNEPNTNRSTPMSKTPSQETNRWNSNVEKSPKKSARSNGKDDTKFSGKMTWGDSDDDDWDDFLGKPSNNSVRKPEPRAPPSQKERDLNPDPRPEPEEHYPETYAQRLNRQQYTFGQDRLIREKTIYRNPEEWGDDGDEVDEDEPMTSEVTKGFDASRFRAANQGQQSARDKDLFTPRQDDIEVPKPTNKNDNNEVLQEKPKPRPLSRKVPVYTKEEEDLMAELIDGNKADSFMMGHQLAHQSAHYV